jgi:hypothetical protein
MNVILKLNINYFASQSSSLSNSYLYFIHRRLITCVVNWEKQKKQEEEEEEEEEAITNLELASPLHIGIEQD